MSNTQKSGCSGCFTSFMFMILIAIVCVLYVNISNPDDISDSYPDPDQDMPVFETDDSYNDDTEPVPDDDENEPPSHEIEEEEYLYYYNQLNEEGKTLYNELLKAAKEGKDKVTLKEINYADYSPVIKSAIYAFTYDYPIYFWITNGYRTEYHDRTGTQNDDLTFHFKYYSYWNFTMSPDKYINQLQTEIDKVVALAEVYDDPFDQAVFVHDYLIHHAEYDHDGLAEAKKTIHAASSEYIYSAYGCLVNKKTVCSGYSEAFQLIMNELCINTTVVVGDAGGPHEWNMIEFEGEYYYIDITWDDHDRKNDSGVFIYTNDSEYEYMCITSEELKKTHMPDAVMFSPPNCLYTKYNYFVYNGYQLSDYSLSEVERIVTAQAATKKIISVRFANQIEFNEAVNDLFNNKNAFSIVSLSKGYKYVTDDKHYTIKFFLE